MHYLCIIRAQPFHGVWEKVHPIPTSLNVVHYIPTLQLTFSMNLLSHQYAQHLATPLLTMVSELCRQESELHRLLKKKDAEIEDYKAAGGKVSRSKLLLKKNNNKSCLYGQPTYLSRSHRLDRGSSGATLKPLGSHADSLSMHTLRCKQRDLASPLCVCVQFV